MRRYWYSTVCVLSLLIVTVVSLQLRSSSPLVGALACLLGILLRGLGLRSALSLVRSGMLRCPCTHPASSWLGASSNRPQLRLARSWARVLHDSMLVRRRRWRCPCCWHHALWASRRTLSLQWRSVSPFNRTPQSVQASAACSATFLHTRHSPRQMTRWSSGAA